jgi:MoaA/NifB/PqqE/SkfB family radical SAM enzyme
MSFLNIVYNRANFFRKTVHAHLTGKTCPLVVTFSMTPRCNFTCKYCYGDYKSRPHKQITTDEALNLVEEMANMGTQYLQLSGGEPLLFPGIEKVISFANKRRICLGINTNGSLIKQNIALVKQIKTICVSLDGNEQANDANRGVGTYKKAMEGIEAAQSAGVRVHIYVTLTRNNVNCLDWLMEFCRRKRIYAEFGFLVSRSLKSDQNYKQIDLDTKTFRRIQARLVDYKKRGYPILFSKKILQHIQSWPDFSRKMWFNEPPRFPYIPCYQGNLMIFVDCDGKVYPCIQMIGKFEARDFRKVGFEEAYLHCKTHECKACYLMCVNDFNLLFAMNPGVIMNNIIITMKELLLHRK